MSHLPATDDQQQKPTSRGEKIFDWMVYGGIGGVGAFVATLLSTYSAKYGHGASYFKASTDWLQKKGWSAASAEKFTMTNATMQGGNLMVLPVKWAEDNKIAIIQKINDTIGEKTDIAALEAEDKQSWSSIVKARVAAWITVFTSFHAAAHIIGDQKFAAFEDSFAKNVVCKPLGMKTHINGKETTAFKYGKIAAIDTFATIAASTLLFVGSRIFAHWERKAPAEEAMETVAHPAPVLAESKSENYAPSQAVAKILKNKPQESFAALASKQAGAPTLAI